MNRRILTLWLIQDAHARGAEAQAVAFENVGRGAGVIRLPNNREARDHEANEGEDDANLSQLTMSSSHTPTESDWARP